MIQNTIDFQQKINVDVTTKFDENEILKTFFLLNSIQNWIQNSEISWIQFYKIFIKFEKWLSIMAILISMLGQDNEILSEGKGWEMLRRLAREQVRRGACSQCCLSKPTDYLGQKQY